MTADSVLFRAPGEPFGSSAPRNGVPLREVPEGSRSPREEGPAVRLSAPVAKSSSGPVTSARRSGRAFLAVPLVLVNVAAVWGQAGWAQTHIAPAGWAGWVVAVLFAFAIESIGIYLAWESHESLMADQASAQLRIGSYAIGLLAGILNFLHFSETNATAGIAFGALSTISPWLWAIWSRARNRTRLAELGLVDVRGVKLSGSRKLWHPIRSLHVMSWAAWEGITDPREAVAGWTETQEAASGGRHGAGSAQPAQETGADRIRALRAAEPELSHSEIATRVGTTVRWVRKVLEEKR